MKKYEIIFMGAVTSVLALWHLLVVTAVVFALIDGAKFAKPVTFFGIEITPYQAAMSLLFYYVISTFFAFASVAMWFFIFRDRKKDGSFSG